MTNEIEKLIEQNNLKLAVYESSVLILRGLSDFDAAHHFVMIELDSARQGSAAARRFVEAAAIPMADYEDVQYCSAVKNVSPIGATELLKSVCSILGLDRETGTVFRLAVADLVMKEFHIGPYMLSNAFLQQMPMESIMNRFSRASESLVDYVSKEEKSPLGLFVNMMNDLATYAESCAGDPTKVLMAYAYARRCVSAGLYVQGVFDRDEYAYQEQTFRNHQQKLALENEDCQSKEFQVAAGEEAIRFLLSYDRRLTSGTVGLLVGSVLSIVPDEAALCPKDEGMLLTPDGVFAWVEGMSPRAL